MRDENVQREGTAQQKAGEHYLTEFRRVAQRDTQQDRQRSAPNLMSTALLEPGEILPVLFTMSIPLNCVFGGDIMSKVVHLHPLMIGDQSLPGGRTQEDEEWRTARTSRSP